MTEEVYAVNALRREIRVAAIAQIAGALCAARITAGQEAERGADVAEHARQIYREAERP